MKTPEHSTSIAFCELVENEAAKHDLTRNQDVCSAARIANATWVAIKKRKIPNLQKAPWKQIKAWTRVVTRLCDLLDLDLAKCLEACDLPYSEILIQQTRSLAGRKAQLISEEDLQALLKLVADVGKPIPLTFAFEGMKGSGTFILQNPTTLTQSRGFFFATHLNSTRRV